MKLDLILSKKQGLLFNDIITPNKTNISVLGSVQSGKTWDIAFSTIQYAQRLHEYDNTRIYNGAIVGWSLEAVKGNIVDKIEIILNKLGIQKATRKTRGYELKFGGGASEKYLKLWNFKIYFYSFNNVLSMNNILGKDLIYIWVDESARIYSRTPLQEQFDQLPRKASSFRRTPLQEKNR